MRALLAFRISAVFGFLGVALGAFGAHALEARLEGTGMVETWDTAVFYLLVHAVVMAGVAGAGWRAGEDAPVPRVWWAFAGGVLFFSGSLFGLALGGPGVLGPVTPLGGLSLLAGWAWLAARPPTIGPAHPTPPGRD